MIIYFAGYHHGLTKKGREIAKAKNAPFSALISYFEILNRKETLEDLVVPEIDSLYVDCGAYTAWSKNIEIDIDKYIQFIKDNQTKYGKLTFAALDVIYNEKKSYENYLHMKEAGLNCVPCFHFGEDISYLKKYIDQTDYIALGGLAGKNKSVAQIIDWFDPIFSKYLMKEDKTARVKIHGYACTSLTLLKRYPWYSVDSTSWIQSAAYGYILTPIGRVYMSNIPKILDFDIRAYDNLREDEIDFINKYLQKKDYPLSDLRESSEYRKCFNMGYYKDFITNLQYQPSLIIKGNLFD